MEHLFYVSDPEENEKEDIMRIIEEGFRENEPHSVCILAQLSIISQISDVKEVKRNYGCNKMFGIKAN